MLENRKCQSATRACADAAAATRVGSTGRVDSAAGIDARRLDVALTPTREGRADLPREVRTDLLQGQ
ncbi:MULTISPECIES: hypothetical protein [Sorangium]|uniref:hypothetical protein n=1 Tax=Sorangium TaxID=39643 RepID=UPI003D9C3BB3